MHIQVQRATIAALSLKWRGDTFLVVIMVALTSMIYLLMVSWVWPFTMDDAFISFRYSKHIGEGIGPIWNLADLASPIEGFTSFLHVWTLGAIVFFSDIDTVLAGKILGVLVGLALFAAVVREVHRYQLKGLAAAVALSVFVLPITALHSVSGMETLLYTLWLFICATTCARLLQSANNRLTWAFVFFGLLGTLSRPEFGLPFLLMAAYLWWQRPALRWTLLQSILVLYVLPGVAITLWRLSYYGDIFPHPFHLKQDGDINRYGTLAVIRFVSFAAVPYLVLIGAQIRSLWASHRNLLVITALNFGVSTLYFATTFPLMDLWFRFLFPQIPLLALLAAVAAQKSRERGAQPFTAVQLLGVAATALMLLAAIAIIAADLPDVTWWSPILLPALPLALMLMVITALAVRTSTQLPTTYIRGLAVALIVLSILAVIPMVMWWLPAHEAHEIRYREVGQRLRPFAQPDRWLRYYDVGSVVYESEWNTIDIVGLNTRPEDIKTPCERVTDVVMQKEQHVSSQEIPNPCPNVYEPLIDLPILKQANTNAHLYVFTRRDLPYSEGLRESLGDNWPQQFTRQSDWTWSVWKRLHDIIYYHFSSG